MVSPSKQGNAQLLDTNYLAGAMATKEFTKMSLASLLGIYYIMNLIEMPPLLSEQCIYVYQDDPILWAIYVDYPAAII